MRFIPLGAEVDRVQNRAVGPAVRVGVDHHEEVIILGVGIDTEDVEVFLGPVEPFHKRRQTGLGHRPARRDFDDQEHDQRRH